MIKIKPQLYSNIKRNPSVVSSQKVNKNLPKLDFSGEEYGYFKFGERIIKTIFPR